MRFIFHDFLLTKNEETLTVSKIGQLVGVGPVCPIAGGTSSRSKILCLILLSSLMFHSQCWTLYCSFGCGFFIAINIINQRVMK